MGVEEGEVTGGVWSPGADPGVEDPLAAPARLLLSSSSPLLPLLPLLLPFVITVELEDVVEGGCGMR